MATWRRVAICVDDFGLDAAVNDGALRLLALGRVSALACLSTAPAWPEAARRLKAEGAGRADAGLHLNLSEAFGPAQWRRRLGPLIASAYSVGLPARALRHEIAAQLDAFEQAMDRAPDFVDGHQHVHQLPGVRELLVEELLRRYPGHRPWLRDTAPPRGGQPAGFKHRLIAALGARRLSGLAHELGFAQNRGMLGVYDFGGSVQAYAEKLAAWCEDLPDGGLLICHAASQARPDDPIGAARAREFEVLASDAFGQLLQSQRLSVGRLSEHPAAA